MINADRHLAGPFSLGGNATRAVMAAVLVASGLAAGCGDDGMVVMRDTSPPRPGDSGVSSSWTTEVASTTAGGHALDMTIIGGSPTVAYFASSGREDGPCEEVRMDPEEPPTRIRYGAYVSERRGGLFTERQLTEVLALVPPQGLDLAEIGGELRVAMLEGEAYNMGLQKLCSAHDLGLYRGDGTSETLAENSNEAPYDAASDAGFMVGHWPAIATDGANSFVFHRDTHYGGIQSDDERRADLEVVITAGGSTRAVSVDSGRGSGRFSDAILDAAGNPYVAYVNDFEFDDTSRGTLVARSLDGGDSFEFTRIAADHTERGPSIWLDGDDNVRVAYYDTDRRELAVATLTDADAFDSWDIEYLSSGGYDEGRDPSGATSPAGDVAVAYHRCARTSRAGGACVDDDDALVVAHLGAGETDWTYEVVDEGEEGAICGTQAAAEFDSDGTLWVAYVCQNVDGSTVRDQVKVAEREAYE